MYLVMKASKNLGARLLALAILVLLFIASAVAVADTMNDHVTDYGLIEFYGQTSWASIHRDSRNSDFSPFVAPVEAEVKWTALEGSTALASVTLGPEGNLYVTTGKETGNNLHAFDRDGNHLWNGDLDSGAIGSGAVPDVDGDIYITDSDQFWAFHPDGSVKWVKSIPISFITAIFTVEGYVGGITGTGNLSLRNRDNGDLISSLELPQGVPTPQLPGPHPKGLWGNNTTVPEAITLMDPAISKSVFEFLFGRGAPVSNTPAVNPLNNRIYITAAGPRMGVQFTGLLYGIDITPGGGLEIAFSAPMGAGSGTSPAISPNGLQVYASDGVGNLYAFDALTDNPAGEVVWVLPIGENVASPSVGPDGTIYSLAGGEVIAISENGDELWRINFDAQATSMIPQISPLIPRDSRANSVISVTPNRLYLTANLGYRLPTPTGKTFFMAARTFVFVIDPADGSIVASPVELRDTTEGGLTMASDGSIYITHGAIVSSISLWGVIPTIRNPGLKAALLNAMEVQPIGGISALEPVSFLALVESGIDWVQQLDNAALDNLAAGGFEDVDEAYTQVRRGVVQLGATANSISDAEERLELDSQSAQQARQRVDTAQVLLNDAKRNIAQARIAPNAGLLISAMELIENAEFQLGQAFSILAGSAAPPIAKTISKELRFSEGIPVKSELVQNYPNPFNPETWIPYNLAKDADVIIKIYNVSGQLIRTLDLDRKDADFYLSKDKAAYWDGRDNLGERVASGIYFYTLKAGDFRATRRMLIMK